MVARILKVSRARERTLEQRSVMELQAATITGCAHGASASSASARGSFVALAPAPSWAPARASLSSSPPATVAASAGGRSVPASSSKGSAHGQATVVVAPAANRGVERAGAGSSLPAAAMIPAFAALILGLCLVALPGVRRRLVPAGAGPAAAREGARAGARPARVSAEAMTPAATAIPASRAAAGAPAHEAEPPPTDATDATDGATAAAPAAHPQAHVEHKLPHVHVVPPPAPPVPSGRTAWVREHAGQAAMVATVVAGGLARLASRGRGRGRTRR